MKNIFLLILFLLTICTGASAQWSIGLKAGPAFSNYKSKTPWKAVTHAGYAFGATAQKQIDKHLGVNFGLEYIQKGYFHKVCNTIYDKLEAGYLEIPLSFDYTFNIPYIKNFRGHAYVGFYSAYWLSGKYETKGFDSNDESFDFEKNNASRFDFGPNAGGKIDYLLKGGNRIVLDFRYELGIIDLQKKAGDNTVNINKAFVIGISYIKPLGM